MKILWASNAPWSTSGYGCQTALTVPRIQALGHDITVECFFGLEGAMIDWNGITCLPCDATRFGNLMRGEYADWIGEGDRGDVLTMTLMDVWVMLPGLQHMKDVRFACWTPIDHDPAPPLVVDFLRQSNAEIIAMSRFGVDRLERAGFHPYYAPHAVDTNLFRPMPERKQEFRQKLGIPQDAFVMLMVAFNQGIPSRKAFSEVFDAFASFQRRHNDSMLFIHSDVFGRNNGLNLIDLGKNCGIPETALRASNQLKIHLGMPQEDMPPLFNAADVLVMPSFGEGFGIPVIEAQACGIPVIATDWTAMNELCGAGWLVDGDRFYDGTQRSWFKRPYLADIKDAMEEAYNHAHTLGAAAREFAMAYDVDKVFEECWVPIMEQLEQPLRIPPLRVAA